MHARGIHAVALALALGALGAGAGCGGTPAPESKIEARRRAVDRQPTGAASTDDEDPFVPEDDGALTTTTTTLSAPLPNADWQAKVAPIEAEQVRLYGGVFT